MYAAASETLLLVPQSAGRETMTKSSLEPVCFSAIEDLTVPPSDQLPLAVSITLDYQIAHVDPDCPAEDSAGLVEY